MHQILCWEFGDGILEHREFKQIAQQIAETMMSDPKLEQAIHGIVDQFVFEQ